MRRPARDRRPGWGAALPILVLLAVAGCDGAPDEGAGEADAEATLSPEAPPLEAVTLAGDSVALAELRGSVVLLNVWATWCAPCRREIPELQALHEELRDDGLRVIGVTVDDRSAGDEVRAFLREFGMTYDIWWDPDQRSVMSFGAMGVPLTVLIGPDGRIRWRHLGALERNDPSLREAVESLLEAAGAEEATAS